MSNQVYQNSVDKYFSFPGNNYYGLSVASISITGGNSAYATFTQLNQTNATGLEVVGAALVFRKQGHFSFNLSLEIAPASGVDALHPEITVEFASYAVGQTSVVARSKIDVNDMIPAGTSRYIVAPISGAVFVNAGDSLAFKVFNLDSQAITLLSTRTQLTISSAY